MSDTEIVQNRFITDDINIINEITDKKLVLICFESDPFEEEYYNEIVTKENIEKIVIFGSRKRKGLSSKFIFAKKMNKSFIENTDNVLFIIRTDIDDEVLIPLTRLKDFCDKKGIEIGIGVNGKQILGISQEINNYLSKTFEALYAESIERKYEIIYDALCDELDEKFKDNTLCKFKDGRCIMNRKKYNNIKTMGCCESFDVKFSIICNVRLCEKAGEKGCTAKGLGCKLFTCEYLRRQGVRFKLKNMVFARTFFTRKQMEILRTTFFVEKEEILKKIK